MHETQAEYERKLARRQRQLDMMEASAAGLLSYNDDVYGEKNSDDGESVHSSKNSESTKSQAPKGAIESARRFLWDEDEDDDYNSAPPLHNVSSTHNHYTGQQHNLVGVQTSPGFGSRVANTIGSFFRSRDNTDDPQMNKERNLAPHRTASIQHIHNDARSREADEYMEDPHGGFFALIGECCMAVIYTVVGFFAILCEYLTGCLADITPKLCVMIVAAMTGFGLVIFAIVAIAHRSGGGGGGGGGSTDYFGAGLQPSVNEVRYGDIRSAITTMAFTSEKTLDTPGTAQNQALRWLTDDDPAELPADDKAILQRYALATFYFSTYANAEIVDVQGNAGVEGAWTYSDNWMSKKGVCKWFGVSCSPQSTEGVEENDNSDIIHFNLTDNNMRGIIPSELAALENLVSLDLSKNKLEGTVPKALANFKQLRQLYLEENLLDGRVHSEYGKMLSLCDLLLGTNKFTGSIPEEIGQLTELFALGLDDNALTGSIPNIWGSTKLLLLYLDCNQLTGTISPNIGAMKELIDVRLRKNVFTGTIPEAIHSLTHLENLYLDNNRFTGTLLDSWDLLTRLQELQLYENALTGTLPQSMGGLKDMKILYMDKNKFKGTVPASYGDMAEIQTFFLSNNELSGTVPTTLGKLADLKNFQITNNNFGGALPSELGNCYKLEKLVVQDNKLTGNVPSEIGALQNLHMLKLYRNELSGSMPKEICDSNDVYQLEFIAADCNAEEGGKLACSCCSSCYP